ncbi:DNA polymerase [Mycobacteroides abscessus]
MHVPDRTHYDPVLDAYLHTGENARSAVDDLLTMTERGVLDIAIDIETPGLIDQFTINCVTAAWEAEGAMFSVLLDPRRNPHDARQVFNITQHAGRLILHNSAFDSPALVHHKLMKLEDVNKVVDTVLLARMAFPDVMVSKKLTPLSIKHLGMGEFAGGMTKAFKAAGFRSEQAGYEGMDIDSPIYRQGAMADTIATLRLEPVMRDLCRDWLTNHPFVQYGATRREEADELIAIQETVHRVMLRRTTRGINVDREALNQYAESVDGDRQMATALLAEHGLVGGASKGGKIVEYIHQQGELPPNWPRTKGGKLSAAKEYLSELDHPLANAQRLLSDTDKILGYLNKADFQAQMAGRCYPQVGILGASATGRMAASDPPYQQFSAKARPIFLSENPDADENVEWFTNGKGKQESRCAGPGKQLWSIDWSQIEPVTMGLMAKDDVFVAPYEAGDDLYEPLMRAAGIDRDTAKVNLLATMYGRGIASLARALKTSEEKAAQIRRQMLAAMPASARWMTKVQTIAEEYGKVITADGRILSVDKRGVFRAVNYTVQGSAYGFLAHAIVEMERRGLGDLVVLGMHDELVIDATEEQAIEVEQIMRTPPEFIIRWAERTPVLRTDRAPMGRAWAKV